MEELLRYEYNEVPSTEYRILPSPETIYNMNNLYLMKICELIEEKREVIENDQNEKSD